MATENNDRDKWAAAGAKVLGRHMARRGWSAPEVARRTDGSVSGSSVLAYANGQTLPTPANALAVAQAFGREETLELLRAWGFTELADAFEERTPGAPVSSYSLDRDSETPARTVPLGWRFEGEVVARTATSHGDAWLVRTTTGTLLRVVPVFEFEASDSFLAALSGDEPDETTDAR